MSRSRGRRRVVPQAGPSPDKGFKAGEEAHRAGDLERAEGLYREVLSTHPDHAETRHLLGVVLHQRGRSVEGAEEIARAVALRPGIPHYLSNHGEALRAAGRLEAAEKALEAALAINPRLPEAWNNLGLVRRGLGRPEEASHSFQKALENNVAYVEAYCNLGDLLREQGEPAAETAFQKALDRRPDYPEAWRGLLAFYQADGRLDAVEELLGRAPLPVPELGEAWIQLGIARLRRKDLEQAEAAFRRSLEFLPTLAMGWNNLAAVLMEQAAAWEDESRTALAREACREALRLDPQCADAWNSLGNVHYHQGEIPQARKAYEEALALQPDYPAALRHWCHCRKFAEADRERVTELKGLLDVPCRPEEESLHLHFAFGKMLDELGDYDEAFRHYAAGNRIMHGRSLSQVAERRERTDALIRFFTPGRFDDLAGRGNASEVPVFIVGLPRSGTTLVEQILMSHPRVYGAGELHHLEWETMSALEREERDYPEVVAGLDRERCGELAESYLERLRRDAPGEALRVTDKMPANFFHLGLIATLFPRARVIHCRRHPLDTGLSLFFQLFNELHDYAFDLERIGGFIREYWRLMDHWRRVLPLPMLEIDYEAVVENQEEKSRELIDFLGLPWDDACLRPEKTHRRSQTASAWQVRQPVYRRSVARWRHYAEQLAPLREALGLDLEGEPL